MLLNLKESDQRQGPNNFIIQTWTCRTHGRSPLEESNRRSPGDERRDSAMDTIFGKNNRDPYKNERPNDLSKTMKKPWKSPGAANRYDFSETILSYLKLQNIPCKTVHVLCDIQFNNFLHLEGNMILCMKRMKKRINMGGNKRVGSLQGIKEILTKKICLEQSLQVCIKIGYSSFLTVNSLWIS